MHSENRVLIRTAITGMEHHMAQLRVCHLTSVHLALDTRVFHKEARSLAEAGYDLMLNAQS